ncbi:GNAT family N-acetyltransferase [Euzebya tangerina]|uniref:GNAT family N-acetyltransferase n=1 Tax=Euzebya tangerina TaxID=591198 RepID=UPI000E317409|nr:GNAT family N-acetyltransferase [Euzebya tangerina]
MSTPPLRLRLPIVTDEEQVRAAESEFAGSGFIFALGLQPDDPFDEWVERVRAHERGEQLPDSWVPSSFLLGVIDGADGDVVVGRTSIRYELNDFLVHEGGHVGYGVRPQHRHQGFATAMLRLSLARLEERGITRVLVTCDDDNLGSAAVIEACGGVLEDRRHRSDDTIVVRRYWIG